MRDVRRRRNPLQTGLNVIHLTFPTLHLHDMKLALLSVLQHLFGIQHQSQFTASQAINVRNLKLTDERDAIVFHQVTFNLQATQWIRTVEDNQFLTIFSSSFHGQTHGADVSERTASIILNVIHQNIYILQHFRSSFSSLSI